MTEREHRRFPAALTPQRQRDLKGFARGAQPQIHSPDCRCFVGSVKGSGIAWTSRLHLRPYGAVPLAAVVGAADSGNFDDGIGS